MRVNTPRPLGHTGELLSYSEPKRRAVSDVYCATDTGAPHRQDAGRMSTRSSKRNEINKL